jgi:hypothetical protein
MCPACMEVAALIAISATSTGGIAALVVTKFHKGTGAKKIEPAIQIEEGKMDQFKSVNSDVERPTVVSQTEWFEARKAHLAREKEVTRRQDALSAELRKLPMVRVDKEYTFDGPAGR